MKRIRRVSSVLIALIMLCCFMAAKAFAEEGTTTTTAASADVSSGISFELKNGLGSNGKFYPADKAASSKSNSYSFTVPAWMEKITIVFTSSGVTVTSDVGTVSSSGSEHKIEVEMTADKTPVKATLTKGDAARTVTFTIVRSASRAPRFESLKITDSSGGEITRDSSSAEDAPVYTRNAGVTSLKLQVVARDEGKVILINETKSSDGKFVTPDAADAAKPLENSLPLESGSRKADLTLIDGTNTFLVQVIGGDVKKERKVTIIVGNKDANALGAGALVSPSVVSPTDFTTTTTVPTMAPPSKGISMSPIMWVLVAIIAVVVLGTVIFMVVNMSSGRRDYDDEYDDYGGGYARGGGRRRGGYDDYDDGGYGEAPLHGGRRNLGDYAGDDEYVPRRQQQRYNDYDDDDDSPRRPNRRYDDYDDDDDGGYGGFGRY